MRIFKLFPTMALPAIAYCLVVLVKGPTSVAWWATELFAVHMPSGDMLRISSGSILLAGALLCFCIEMIRTASPSTAAIGTNLLLACAFAPCVGLFLLTPGFGTGEFFLISLMMLLDFLLDSAVLVLTSRRTMEVTGSH